MSSQYSPSSPWVLAPSVFAQTPPPAPKVTIVGTFDQVTTAGRNFYDGNYSRDNDREWYARTRFRPDFVFEVGRTKAVLGLEIDLMYGQGGSNDGGFPGNASGQAGGFAGGTKSATNGALDTNTDVGGMIEIKWIYTEFDLTGKDSLMPFIPFLTVARAGGQPLGTIANYKVYYANGDFAGLDMYSTFTPDIKNHFAFRDRRGSARRREPCRPPRRGRVAVRTTRASSAPSFSPTKGLDLKPMFSWFQADGVTAGAARRNATNVRTVSGPGTGSGGMNSAAATGGGATAGDSANHETRYTIGLDTRWRVGAFGLDPTVSFQWGKYDTQAHRSTARSARSRVEAGAWLFDSPVAISWVRCSSRRAVCTPAVTRLGTTCR